MTSEEWLKQEIARTGISELPNILLEQIVSTAFVKGAEWWVKHEAINGLDAASDEYAAGTVKRISLQLAASPFSDTGEG